MSGGVPLSSKARIREQVRRFARDHGLQLAPKPGNEPLFGKGEWFKVFDSWEQAYAFFKAAYLAHGYHGETYPWDRKENPSQHEQIEKATHLYEQFSGHDARDIGKVNVPSVPPVMVAIGSLDAVLYTTVRDGKREKYIHRFHASDKPVLAVSPDGKAIHIVGGNYTFTERGIVDASDPN